MDEALKLDVQRLIDERAIKEALHRYCRGVDRVDLDMVASAFHADATDNHGVFVGGVAEFLEFGKKFAADPGSPIRRTLHTIANILIEFKGAEEAASETYFLAYHRREEEAGKFDEFIGGRYLDRMTKRAGTWAIAHRDVVYEWSRILPASAQWWDGLDTTNFIFGRHDMSDVVYALR